MVPSTRVERVAYPLGKGRSIQLSYEGIQNEKKRPETFISKNLYHAHPYQSRIKSLTIQDQTKRPDARGFFSTGL